MKTSYYFISKNIFKSISGVFSPSEFRDFFVEDVITYDILNNAQYKNLLMLWSDLAIGDDKIIKNRFATFDTVNKVTLKLLIEFYDGIVVKDDTFIDRWPTLAGRLSQPLTSVSDAKKQHKRNNV